MSSVDANGRGQDLDTATASEERATHVVDQRAQAVATASRSKAAPHLTPAERAARGKAARAELRRSAHDHWEPAPGRADPVELLEIQAQTRLPELGPIRYGRMLVSPFTFFRGAAHLMASDLADGPRTGLHAQLCGDAHLSNFGIFAAPDTGGSSSASTTSTRRCRVHSSGTSKRLAASIAVAGRDRGFGVAARRSAVAATVAEYREAMARFAELGNPHVWYARLDVASIRDQIGARASAKQMKRFQSVHRGRPRFTTTRCSS